MIYIYYIYYYCRYFILYIIYKSLIFTLINLSSLTLIYTWVEISATR